MDVLESVRHIWKDTRSIYRLTDKLEKKDQTNYLSEISGSEEERTDLLYDQGSRKLVKEASSSPTQGGNVHGQSKDIMPQSNVRKERNKNLVREILADLEKNC